MMRLSLSALLFFFTCVYADAQYYKPKNDVTFTEFSIYSGLTGYMGELNNYSSINQILNTRYAVLAEVYRPVKGKLGISGTLGFTQLSGDDFYSSELFSYSRNLQFQSDQLSAETTLSYDLGRESILNRRKNVKELRFFAGIGYANFKSKATIPNKDKVVLNKLSTEGQGLNSLYPEPYKSNFVYIPFGLRYGIRTGARSLLGFSFRYNITFSDYIDDVSHIYPNPLLLNNDLSRELSNRSYEVVHAKTGKDRLDKLLELVSKASPSLSVTEYLSQTHAIGTPRGNPKSNDAYFSISINYTYRIPDRIKCFK